RGRGARRRLRTETGARVEIEVVRVGERVEEAGGAGDHRRVVGAELTRGHPYSDPERLALARDPLAQLAVRGDAAPEREPLQPLALERLAGADRERLHDRALIGGGEVGLPPLGLLLTEIADAVEERGLQPAEGEVEP